MSDNASSWLDFAQRSRDEGGLGLEKHQAAGLVGNLANESGAALTPWGPTGDNGTAWGTAQWRNERLDGLKAHAAENGLDYRTPEAQQAWMRREFDTTHNGAYKALQAATTPEEAAAVVNRKYEVSADRSGRRENTARAIYTDGPTAIEQAMGRGSTGSQRMAYAGSDETQPALRPQVPVGALTSGGAPVAAAPSWLEIMGQTLKDMAPGIAQDPDHAKVLEASAAGSRKAAVDPGSWSMTTLPDGTVARIHNKTGMMIDANGRPITGTHEKAEKDVASQAYDTDTAKAYAAKNQKIADDALASRAALGNLDTLRSALSNPDVYQGLGGETVAMLKKAGNGMGMDFKGVADADVSAALINKLTQESRLLNGGMPGSLSDRDLSFLKAANAGLDKTPEANQRIIDIYEKLHKRNIEMNQERLAYTADGKHLDEGFTRKLDAKWTAEHAPDNEKFKTERVAPAAAPTSSFKTPSGVQWRRN